MVIYNYGQDMREIYIYMIECYIVKNVSKLYGYKLFFYKRDSTNDPVETL